MLWVQVWADGDFLEDVGDSIGVEGVSVAKRSVGALVWVPVNVGNVANGLNWCVGGICE